MKNKLILVPGLGDEERFFRFASNHFLIGIETNVYIFRWRDNSQDFETKMQQFIDVIDDFSKGGDISLAGSSAGASACFNAFYQRKNKIKRLINICGRLRVEGKPSLEWAARSSKSFSDSVRLCEKGLARLTKEDKKKILTIRPIYDEIVPSTSVPVEGAKNIKIISIEHMLSGALCLTIYSKLLSDFVNS